MTIPPLDNAEKRHTVLPQGTFLMELAEFERAQDPSRISAVRFEEVPAGVILQSLAGTELRVPFTAARQHVYDALLPHDGALQRPSNADPSLIEGPEATDGVWVELLYDLGASLRLLDELVPGLRVGAVRREGSTATVSFHAAGRHRSFSLNLASGQETSGISIDWAFEFRDESWQSSRT